MKLSTQCRYGARAILYIASQSSTEPVKRKDIARNEDIPDSYLENILLQLKRKGLISTVRGWKGGYVLAKKPEEITLMDIVTTFINSLEPVECLGNADYCTNTHKCLTRDVWKKLQHAQEEVLGTITLKELLNKGQKNYKADYAI